MYKKAPELVPVGWVEHGGMSIALPVGPFRQNPIISLTVSWNTGYPGTRRVLDEACTVYAQHCGCKCPATSSQMFQLVDEAVQYGKRVFEAPWN
jgi:hypothetical protein